MNWNDDELNILKRLWIRCDINRFDIAKVILNHTSSAIAKKASDLQLKKESNSKIDIDKLGEMELFEV